jgi:hypothetical protein
VAVSDFSATDNYAITYPGSADRPDKATFFFRVPDATPAFVASETTTAGRVRIMRFHPYGIGLDNSSAGYQTGGSQQRTTSNPLAGVWEVTVDASRTSPASPATFSVTGSILGVTVAPNPDVIASATVGVPVARSYSITNLLGDFTGRAVGTALGSARVLNPTIDMTAPQTYPVNVTAGSTSLRAKIGATSDLGADLDLYVFNCTADPCVLAGQSAGGSSEESVTIANPAVGAWVVMVDPYAIPNGKTSYQYLDVFANTSFGTVSITDADALRTSGGSWTVPGTVTANAVPATGRVLRGTVDVKTSSSVVVGSGEVFVMSVTP